MYSKTILGSNLGPFWGQMAPKSQPCEFAGTIRPAYGPPIILFLIILGAVLGPQIGPKIA